MKKKENILTGDRPTGPLHVGHFVGSLANRIQLQDKYNQFIMIADTQALTDHYEDPKRVRDSVFQVLADYLAVGIDPKKTTIFIQSEIPEIAELALYFMNLVTWNRLKHNPTVKAEINLKKFESVPAGFMVYPISQAADITAFKARYVPVGDDQLPMLEQTQEIVKKFNRLYKKDVLVYPEAILSDYTRLPGTDGKEKMSKSLNNAIYLGEEENSFTKKIKKMYTDPNHLRVEDPGEVKGNPVFTYLDAFDPDKKTVNDLKEHYKKGGLGDSVVKKRLLDVMQNFLKPIREKRSKFIKNHDYLVDILKKGTEIARHQVQSTMREVKEVMFLDYF